MEIYKNNQWIKVDPSDIKKYDIFKQENQNGAYRASEDATVNSAGTIRFNFETITDEGSWS